MFVGHYGASFAGKRVAPAVPLWILFVAVQFVDVLWGIFVLLGIERVRIVPGITETNPLDLYYMPYTHSLIGAAAWAVAGGVAYAMWRGGARRGRVAAVVGAAVFSHWVLDLLVHRPDLPLIGDTMKVGLGLWNVPAVAFALEAGLLFGGIALYTSATRPARAAGRYAVWLFGAILLAIQAMVFFGAPPTSDTAAASSALIAYVVLALAAAWVDRTRTATAHA